MARRFKKNKYTTNFILFLMMAGVIAELLPYILIIFPGLSLSALDG